MSWLVAPWWTKAACSGAPRAARKASTKAGTTTPAEAAPAARPAGSMATSRAARWMARAAVSGIRPSSPWAFASAPSASSIARTSAASEKSRAAWGSERCSRSIRLSKGLAVIGILRGG